MPTEAEFIATIASNPDDDLPRLVFADWLEENGQKERADYIRLAIQFDPHRDRFDDEGINEQRRTLDELEEHERASWELSFLPEKLSADRLRPRWWRGGVAEFRRGFVDAMELPVQWWIEYGQHFRTIFPTLRKLVLFRLNGWGERLAACESLRGIRELELACWYSNADAVAVANCPHLMALERLVVWSEADPEQYRSLASSARWPKLAEMHLVSRGEHGDWVSLVNEAAGRQIATLYDFSKELFPFAANFRSGFFTGRMPDGSQLYAHAGPSNQAAVGWLFHPDGRRREPFRFDFPADMTLPELDTSLDGWRIQLDRRHAEERSILEVRAGYFAGQTGFVQAFIRVEEFDIPDKEWCCPYGYTYLVEECWGCEDDPLTPPDPDQEFPNGLGGKAYRVVRNGEYRLNWGEWWCDRSGYVVAT